MQCVDMQEPWATLLKNGEISGHPDFNSQGLFTTYRSCGAGVFPIGTCLETYPHDTSIINTTLVVNQAGIPKPEYCSEGEDSRCGRHYAHNRAEGQSDYGQTRKKIF